MRARAAEASQPREASACERLLGRPAVAALVCLLLTALLSWPLVPRLGSALPAGAGDLWQNVWNFWWWDTALREGRSPLWTPYFFHPRGAELVFHTHSPFNMLVFAPFASPQTAYGLAVIVSTWLASFGAYLLAHELTRSSRAGVVAGLVFAFFPQRLEQTLEHLNLFSTQFLPLALWAYFRLARAGGRAAILALGVFFALNALCDWQLAIMLSLLLAAVALATWIRPPRPRVAIARDLALAGLLAAVLTLPAAWPLLQGMLGGELHQKAPVEKGIDLTFVLRPHFHHPLWGRFTRDGYATSRFGPTAGFVSYLGVAPLALAGIALARRSRGSALWAGIFFGSLLLALGEHPRWQGRLLQGVTLPFAWLRDLPLLSLLRVANRFLIPASLALSVLAAMGFAALRRRSDVAFGLAAALVVLDYLWLPYPLREDRPSPLYALLRDGGPPGAVLDVPFTEGPTAVPDLRAQVVHGRPIAGGYVSVPSEETSSAIDHEPALADLFGFAPRLARPIDRERLVALGFGVVILHKDRRRSGGSQPPEGDPLFGAVASRLGAMADSRMHVARRRLEEACGPPFYEDETVAAFDLGRGSAPHSR